MSSSFWDMLGKASSVMQLTGVDAFGMVSMIIQAARTVRRNRDQCQQLAVRVQIVSDLLRELQIPELRRHAATRRPLDELCVSLFCAYVLVWSCGQQEQRASRMYQMWTGADMASMLREAKDKIDSYIILIPMITTVASVRARGTPVRDTVNDDPAPALRRPRLSIEEVTESLVLEEEPLPEHLLDLQSMIVQSANTANNNREQCRQLAQQAQIAVGNLLDKPLDTQRLALEQLEGILFRAYLLICFCSQYNRSQLYQMSLGVDVDCVFRLAQNEISNQTNPMIDLVPAQMSIIGTQEAIEFFITAMRMEPKIIVSLLTKGARPSDLTFDHRKAVQISKRLTKHGVYFGLTEDGKPSPKDRLCIGILEQAERRDPQLGEVSVSLAIAGDCLRGKLLYLENRVALARVLFPMKAKVAMDIANLPATEMQGTTVDLNDTPFIMKEEHFTRMKALSETVELGKRFFPRCSKVLDKIMDDEIELASFGRERHTSTEKKMKLHDLQDVLQKAFSEDKEENDRSARSSTSSSTTSLGAVRPRR